MLSRDARCRLALALLAREELTLQFEAGGFTWTAPTGDDIPAALLVHGSYGADEVRDVTQWLATHRPRPGRHVLEIGANIGTTTLPLAEAGWYVLAVEPIPRTFEFLTTNVAQNGATERVTCVRTAIAEIEGSVAMVVSHALGRSHVTESGQSPLNGTDEIEVPATTIGRLAADAGLTANDIGWVWCDTEGSEASVIRSGAALWDSGVPLFAEVGPRYGVRELVAEHFAGFLPSSRVAVEDDPIPISEFGRFLEQMTVLDDVLFLP
jgi:FkbM family methyltransferase